mmetsp:Transcript_7161/g.9675  ORF Transcript_7161/g.9675 Transcript_7161/m.9675 type:complete len:94 (-) Transcript_7161:200-481(-)
MDTDENRATGAFFMAEYIHFRNSKSTPSFFKIVPLGGQKAQKHKKSATSKLIANVTLVEAPLLPTAHLRAMDVRNADIFPCLLPSFLARAYHV